MEICRNLIRFDTSNFGGNQGPGERAAAEYVAELLAEVGLEPALYESAPGRTTVVARMEGSDPSLPALVVHGHLDVVPAAKEDWSVDPFAAEVRDGMIWGRGAVDMKDMDAMILSVLRQMRRDGTRPRRDLVFAFFADEEAGGEYGARWMVEKHPEALCRRHRGDQRGGRVLRHHRRPSRLPAADGREGHCVAGPEGRGAGRARVADQ